MVERYVRDVEAAGSNPVASIGKVRISGSGILSFLFFDAFSEGRRAKTALWLFLGAAWVRHAYPAPGRAGSNPVASIEKRISDPGILFFLFFGASVRDVGQKQPFGYWMAPGRAGSGRELPILVFHSSYPASDYNIWCISSLSLHHIIWLPF